MLGGFVSAAIVHLCTRYRQLQSTQTRRERVDRREINPRDYINLKKKRTYIQMQVVSILVTLKVFKNP